ncbi:peptidase S8/S53 family subtilisin-related protein (plasmid) [Rhizobium sp. NXC24]|nr:peptidase S8/S53 family subtilisin-related protein [Rhizobium sp. NXC24]
MEWRKTDLEHSYCRIEGIDPNADWVLGPGFRDFSRGHDDVLIPCTIGPLDKSMVDMMRTFHKVDAQQGGWESGVFVPSLYHDATEGQHMIAFVRRAVFDDLARGEGPFGQIRTTAKQIDMSLPLNPKSLPNHWKSRTPASEPVPLPVFSPGHWPKDTVVIGIIDDGIAFAHERFRLADGSSRVQYVWRQDGIFDNDGSTVDFGSEICKLDQPRHRGIDKLLKAYNQAGLIDEEGLYREAGLIDFRDPDHKAAAWQLSHGTHVLDQAAGYDPIKAPMNRPIIAVQLPVSVTADTSGSNLKTFATAAIKYILDRADRLAGKDHLPDGSWRPLPVVINFSYGMLAGPHDGTLDLEQALDDFVTKRGAPLRIVLPAGNANLSRCHAAVKFNGTRTPVSLEWRVQPDDSTPTQMEIWLPYDPGKPNASRVTIAVETPSGLRSPRLKEEVGSGVQLVSNDDVVACAHYAFRSSPTKRGVFIISLQPTARLRPLDNPAAGDATAPAGVWKVIITNSGLRPEQELEAWIQWDDVIYGYSRRGRQSYFEADCYRRFDPVTGDVVDVDDKGNPCIIRRGGLINAIATGDETIVVGGVQQKDLTPPKYAAGGPVAPTRDKPSHRVGPDAACVSDDSRVHNGILGAGSRSGSVVAMSGTSVAVPQIVKLVADMLADGDPGNRESISRFAAAEERARWEASGGVNPEALESLDKERCGAGRIVRPRRDWLNRYERDT